MGRICYPTFDDPERRVPQIPVHERTSTTSASRAWRLLTRLAMVGALVAGGTEFAAAQATITLAQPNDQRQLDGCTACASFTTAYATPTVGFNGSTLGTVLRYSSELAKPTAYFEFDVHKPGAIPTRFRVRVGGIATNGWMNLTSGGQAAYVRGDTTTVRIGVQYDAGSIATNVYNKDIQVTAFYGDSSAPSSADSTTLVLNSLNTPIWNEENSPYGRGWTVAGDSRIAPAGNGNLLLYDGAGGLWVYTLIGCSGSPSSCTYTSPTGTYSTMVKLTSGNYQRTSRAGSVETWTGGGRLIDVVDRWGNSFAITRMTSGDQNRVDSITVTTVVSSTTVRKSTKFSYDGNGKLSSIRLPDGRVSTFTVGAGSGGELTVISDPDGRTAMRATYSGGRMVGFTGRAPDTTNVEYDTYGQVARLIAPRFTIDSGTTVRDTTSIFSQRRVLLEGQTTTTVAATVAADRPDSTFLRIADGRGATVTKWAGVSGAATRIVARSTSGVTETSTYSYDASYRLTSKVTPHSGQTTYTWSGPLVTMQVAHQPSLGFNDTTTYAYTDYDQTDSVQVNGTTRARHFYSGAKLAPDSIKADSSVVTRFTYDGAGHVLTGVDRGGNRTVTISYETTHANPSAVARTATNVTTATTSFTYDGSGRVISTADPVSRVFATKYDSLNRVVRTIGPINDTTRYVTHDSTRTDTLFDAKGQRYVTERNARGLVTRREDPRGKSDYYWYDRLGRVVKSQNRRGDTLRVEYDGLGRITRRRGWTVATGQLDTARFTYDTLYGDWMEGANAESVDRMSYMPEGTFNSLVSSRGGNRTFVVGYGYIDGTWTWSRFVRGDSGYTTLWADTSMKARTVYHRTRAITDYGGKDAELAFDQHGRHVGTVLPTNNTPANKVKEAKGLTWVDEPASQYYTGTNIGTTQNRTYTDYDALGRLGGFHRAATLNPRRTHGYDTGGRLSSYTDWKDTLVVVGWDYVWDELHQEWDSVPAYDYTGTPVRSATYTYDKLANRTDLSASLDSANRLTAFDGWTITYDDAGYMTKRKKATDSLVYTWNAIGQLTQVTSPGNTTTYGYDAFGNRIRKTVNGVATRYLVENGQVIVEMDNAWQPVAKYTYYPGFDRPSSMVRAGKRYYYLQDVQGNVVAVIDSAGTIRNTYEYTPYGEAIATTEAVTNPFRYKGRDWDAEARLYFMRARYYDPQLGRFISNDPIGLAGGINPTSFVSGEPVNRSDPSGLLQCTVWANYDYDRGPGGKMSNVVINDMWMVCDYDNGSGGDPGGGGDPVVHDRCEVAGMLSSYISAVRTRFPEFLKAAGGRRYPKVFDFKYANKGDKFDVGGRLMAADEFGNFAAGYAFTMAAGDLGYVGARLGGVVFAVIGREEHWSDFESAPMIDAGYRRALSEQGGWINHGTYAEPQIEQLPRLPSLTSTAGCPRGGW